MGERRVYFEWVEVEGNQNKFSPYNRYTDADMVWKCNFKKAIVKVVNIWFPKNVGGWVLVRIKKDTVVIAPVQGEHGGAFMTEGFTREEDDMPVFLNIELSYGNRLSFECKNLDAASHRISITLEVEGDEEIKDETFSARELPQVPGMPAREERVPPKFPDGEPGIFRKGV